jgi:hypothetical protein
MTVNCYRPVFVGRVSVWCRGAKATGDIGHAHRQEDGRTEDDDRGQVHWGAEQRQCPGRTVRAFNASRAQVKNPAALRSLFREGDEGVERSIIRRSYCPLWVGSGLSAEGGKRTFR